MGKKFSQWPRACSRGQGSPDWVYARERGFGASGSGQRGEAAELFSSISYLWVEGTHSALGSGWMQDLPEKRLRYKREKGCLREDVAGTLQWGTGEAERTQRWGSGDPLCSAPLSTSSSGTPNSSCSTVLLFHHVLSLSPLSNFFLFPAFSVGFGEKMLEGRVVIKLGLRDYAL